MDLEQFRKMTDRAQQAELDAMEGRRNIIGLPFAPVPHPSALRDWFAGLAMLGKLANGDHWDRYWPDGSSSSPEDNDELTARAYVMADAMLKAREKPESA